MKGKERTRELLNKALRITALTASLSLITIAFALLISFEHILRSLL